MTILVVTDADFANLANGRDLRVWNFCRELARVDRLAYVPLVCDHYPRGEVTLDPHELFCETVAPLRLVNGHAAFRRHFRLNEIRYFRWSYPEYFRRAIELVAAMQKRHAARRIVAFGQTLAGFLEPFRSSGVLLDICDSAALQLERHLGAQHGLRWPERLRLEIQLRRWRRSEATLPHWYSHVVTASEADAEAVRKAAGRQDNVTAVPNGVDTALAAPLVPAPPPRRGVVFWGDLAYPVNDQALRFFFERVYRPRLAACGVEWCILGRNAPPWLLEAARAVPGIRLPGHVPDLRAAVAEYPVVINPMVSGSGVKNKVLEALAMGKAVVSTPLGIESIAGAVDGVHYVNAGTPEALSDAVLELLARPGRAEALGRRARELILERHGWPQVGEKLRALVDTL